MSTQQETTKNYTHEEKMLITQLAAAMYTPEQIQTLQEERASRRDEIMRLGDVAAEALKAERSTNYTPDKEKHSQAHFEARGAKKNLEDKQKEFELKHHLIVKILAFAIELNAPYNPEKRDD